MERFPFFFNYALGVGGGLPFFIKDRVFLFHQIIAALNFKNSMYTKQVRDLIDKLSLKLIHKMYLENL